MFKRPIGFIFYSFEVLISTTELQSISSIGTLVTEIDEINVWTGWWPSVLTSPPTDSGLYLGWEFDWNLTHNIEYTDQYGVCQMGIGCPIFGCELSPSPVVRWNWYFAVRLNCWVLRNCRIWTRSVVWALRNPWKPPDFDIFKVLTIFVIFKDFPVLVGKWCLLGFSEVDLGGQEDFGGQPEHWR